MPQTARRYTVDEVLAFPSDGNRYELVHGELLVSPAPRIRHQLVVGEIFFRLRSYVAEHSDVARVLLSAADISWAEDLLVQPDVFVVPAEEMSEEWSSIRTLLLAVEVISPRTARHDRVVKRAAYQEQGVPTYWIVDPDAAVVEVWRPEDRRPEIVTDVLRWRVSPEAAELEIALHEVVRADDVASRETRG
ncbi:MAG: Uma2 family endonuclease [Gemmatimonadota bacterium]|nr:Uma2 family endonuclease [Gemmatimonadota bacterium]MDH3367974.1 Uma2 family endonuclease [Gemmatimonadota bacterium]